MVRIVAYQEHDICAASKEKQQQQKTEQQTNNIKNRQSCTLLLAI